MLARELLAKTGEFMAARPGYDGAEVVIVGAPMDWTASFRPGAREGPQAIRSASYGLEEFSVYCGRDLRDCRFFDAGDVVLPCGNVQESLRRIGEVTESIVGDGKFLLVLGGEHLASAAVIERVAAFYNDLAVVQLDAHADMRDEYLGQRLSHATVMRRVAEVVGGENLYQFGIRSGDKEELQTARVETNIYFYEVYNPLAEVLPKLKGRPVYVTLDIDVLDPAFAPGTGAPEPAGCTAREILRAVKLLAELELVGFDLVEVCPVYDPAGITALLAAKIIREVILGVHRS